MSDPVTIVDRCEEISAACDAIRDELPGGSDALQTHVEREISNIEGFVGEILTLIGTR